MENAQNPEVLVEKAQKYEVEVDVQEKSPDEDDACNYLNFVWLEKTSSVVNSSLESVFYRIGFLTGKKPWLSILIGLLIFASPLVGFSRYYKETDQSKLWVPSDARSVKDNQRAIDWFPSNSRIAQVLIEASNVLTPDVLLKCLQFHERVIGINFTSKDGEQLTWEDLCVSTGPVCLQSSILELWAYDEGQIASLTPADIADKISSPVSPFTNTQLELNLLLSGLKNSDSDGELKTAKALALTYFIKTKTKSTENKPESEVLKWEDKFLQLAESGIEDLSVYYFAARSFGDIGGGAIGGDLSFLFVGYMLVIIYLALALGKFNFVNQKIGIALTGIISVGMSVGFSYGLSSLFGFFFGPVHNVLPFLLLGIGVDDMFVFVAAWDNLKMEEKQKLLSVSERIALMTKHAGVSILITSLTDFAAFGVGALTIIPALRSFCLYAAMGILGIFFITLFFFSGMFAYDQRRAANKRDACICCYKHGEDYVPNKFSENPLSTRIFRDFISRILSLKWVKLFVCLATTGLLLTGVYGFLNIKQDFQDEWFIPHGNYFYDYIQKSDEYFPQDGDDAYVFFGQIEYYENADQLLRLPESLGAINGISKSSISFWMTSFFSWLENSSDTEVSARLNENKEPKDSEALAYLAHMFVDVAVEGKSFKNDVIFEGDSSDRNYTILRSRMSLKFGKTDSSAEGITIMDESRKVVDVLGLGKTNVFIYSDAMLNWDGDKVIREELFRNILVAFAVVFIVCLLLIAHIATVLLVLSCVVFTLIDVIGFAYLWGVTINVVSTINLVLAIGLAVDYAAHIGHAFMTNTGSRNKRVCASLTEVGTAVFNGGFSTFLAFVPLGFSVSFVFWTFFQIFFLVSMFGLFHGLIYLPVALSILGPSPYASKTQESRSNDQEIELSENKNVAVENGEQQ